MRKRILSKEFLKKLGSSAVKSLGITALAFLLSFLMVSPFSLSIMSLFSSPEKEDFTASDFYAQIANKRPVKILDPDVVIIDIGHSGREEIANLLDTLLLCGPKAVGVDILFEQPLDSVIDTHLIRSIANFGETLVLPVVMAQDDSTGNFVRTAQCFFADETGSAEGAINFVSTRRGATIRTFVPDFHVTSSDTVLSFAVALANIYDKDKKRILDLRKMDEEIIDYPSREYIILNINNIASSSDKITDRIVLIGDMNAREDLHATPLSSRTAGIEIHSRILSTVLGSRYYTALTDWEEWIVALILCFVVLMLNFMLTGRAKGLLIRLVQALLVYLTIRIGYGLFVDHRVIFNASYTLLMLGFGFFAQDIWNGLISSFEWVITTFRRINSNNQHNNNING